MAQSNLIRSTIYVTTPVSEWTLFEAVELILITSMIDKGVPEMYTRLVKDMYHQCETVVRFAAGTSEPFAMEVGLHRGSAYSPFLFAIMIDSLTENIRKE